MDAIRLEQLSKTYADGKRAMGNFSYELFLK